MIEPPLAVAHGGELPAAVWRPESVAHILRRASDATSQGVTFVSGADSTQVSYRELLGRAERIAGGLRNRGVPSGSPVILQLAAASTFLPALWAGLVGGMPPVVLPPIAPGTHTATALRRLIDVHEALGAPPILTDAADVQRLERHLRDNSGSASRIVVLAVEGLLDASPAAAWSPVTSDDTALMMMTSGSTDAPKLIELSHTNVIASVAASAWLNAYRAEDRSLNWLPLFHIGALMRTIRDAYVGLEQVQVSTAFVREAPIRWLELITEHRATIAWATNTSFATIVARSHELTSKREIALHRVRSLHSSGEPVLAATMRALVEVLRPFGLSPDALHTAWGMTEACFATCSRTYFTTLDDRSGPIAESGVPAPGISLRVVDDRDVPLAEGEVGHLQIRGALVGRYHPDFNPVAGACSIDGWLRTGDLATIQRGRLVIRGRAKDVIKIGGVAHSAQEIEAAIAGIAGVDPVGVAAVAVPAGDLTGEALAVFVVPQFANAGVAEIIHAVRSRVASRCGITARFVVPVGHDDLPRTDARKLVRRQLAHAFEAMRPRWTRWPYDLTARGEAGASASDTRRHRALAARLAEIFAAALSGPLDIDDNVFAAGASSLQVAEAVVRAAELIPGRRCELADILHAPTPLMLAARLSDAVDSPAVEGRAAARQRLDARGLAAARARLRAPGSDRS